MNNKRRRLYIFSFVLIAVLACGIAYTAQDQAQTTPMPSQQQKAVQEGVGEGGEVSPQARRRWQQLPPEQKQKLRKRLERWRNLDPAQKAEIKQRFQRYQQLPPELKKKVRQNWGRIRNLPPNRRQEIVEKYKRWQQLPPEKKQLIRERYKRFRGLPPEQRQQLRERREKWQNLAPERKQELREEFRQRTNERRGGRFLKEPPVQARRPLEENRPRPAAGRQGRA